jgi:CheY-like chemotaxis protein
LVPLIAAGTSSSWAAVRTEWRRRPVAVTIPRKRIDMTEWFVAAADGIERPETTVPPSLSIAGNRILAVEDEPLVAAMLGNALTELGFVVIGPIGSIPPALQSARTDAIDGAILDLNLGGEPVYPVADALMARGILRLLTGYRSDGITGAMRVPALQKPSIRRPFDTSSSKTASTASPPVAGLPVPDARGRSA